MSVQIADSRFLVTGGAGFIGSHLTDALLDGGAAEVRVFDDFSRGRRANLHAATAGGRCTVMEGDVADGEALRSACEGVDAVFHFAALRVTRCVDENRRCAETMLMGSYNLFEAARQAGVRRVMYASSASIYGQADELPTPETAPPWPDETLYGAAKLAGEGMARAFGAMYGLPSIVLRPFNVYGPRMDAEGLYTEVLVRWLKRLDEGLPPLVHGDGSHSYDFVYVADVVDAWLRACTCPLDRGVFNVGSGRSCSLLELGRSLCRAWGQPELPIEHRPLREQVPTVHRQARTTAAEESLGWRAQTSLDEGLAALVAWWRSREKRS